MDVLKVLVILLCSFYCSWACKNPLYLQDTGPMVKTNTGSILGTYVKVSDKDVAAFLGIPFAKPPTGHRRFQKPEPIDPWEGMLLGNKISRPCMQYSSKKHSFIATTKPSEDCLYLNVWTPKERCCDSKELRPVLVWIHGGGFIYGSTDIDLYNGSVIAAYGDAVVVSMNYRLGAFGFLYFGIEDAPGNMGLHDQSLALKWIKENIRYFGGDPEKITLFGESAGAISASLHMVSPLSRDLFNRVILQSGTAYHPTFMNPPNLSKRKSKIFAEMTNCSKADEEIDASFAVACLKKLDATTLSQVEDQITSKNFLFFSPSYGNEFLPVSAEEVYDSGNFVPVDAMMGTNRDEGTLFLNFLFPDVFSSDKTPNLTKAQTEKMVSGIFRLLPEKSISEIMDFYFKDVTDQDSEKLVKGLSDSISDYIFNCPTMYLADQLQNGYMYYMTHRSTKDISAKWMGVPHVYDIQFVFGKPIVNDNQYTEEDKRFSQDLIRKWISFAESGHPTDESEWPRYSPDSLFAYELNPRTGQQIKYPHKEACEFWKQFIKKS